MSDKIFDVWADYYNRVVDFDARKDTQDHISKAEAMKIAAHLARTEVIAEAGKGISKELFDIGDEIFKAGYKMLDR